MQAEPDQVFRILLVEDDDVDRLAARRALAGVDAELEIEEAIDVASAVELLARKPFDCALVDYRLPDGTALTLVDRIGSSGKEAIAIVVLTGLDDEAVAVEVLQRGAQDYLIKGRGVDQLWRAVRYAIERKKVQTLQERLARTDRLTSIGQLAAGVVHEVNNPASFILGNLEFMSEDVRRLRAALAGLQARVAASDSPRSVVDDVFAEHDVYDAVRDLEDCLRENREGMERICRIVGDLKSFSRIERDETELVDLRDVARAACNLTRNEARHRARRVEEFEVVPPIVADRGKLTQVAVNLILNAAQAIEEGVADKNVVVVRTEQRGGEVVLSVRDTGCGIAEGDRERIFQPFFTTKERDVGSGLGLALCREIVRCHRGDIHVESEVGKGTLVEMVLPRETGLSVPPAPRGRREEPMPGPRRARVLLIDDDVLVRKIYRRLIESVHDVVEAVSGAAALEMLATDNAFDVLLCDVMMPEVDGPGVYEALRHSDPGLADRMVFLTGGAFTDRSKAFLASVAAIRLEKPVTKAELLDAIDRIAGPPQSLDRTAGPPRSLDRTAGPPQSDDR